MARMDIQGTGRSIYRSANVGIATVAAFCVLAAVITKEYVLILAAIGLSIVAVVMVLSGSVRRLWKYPKARVWMGVASLMVICPALLLAFVARMLLILFAR